VVYVFKDTYFVKNLAKKNKQKTLSLKGYGQKYKYEPSCMLTKVFVAHANFLFFSIFWG